jgi:peptidoglycan/LPS O-acetylase OafA/YrhL
MQFFFGTFLSDLSQHAPHVAWLNARRWPAYFLSPVLILIGLLLASYPEHEPEWMAWSKAMLDLSRYIFPADSETTRFYSGLGLELIALGIHFSPPVKNALSNRYLLWFGKNSFAVYLLHGTLLRTVLVWMLYGFHTPDDIVNEDGSRAPGPNMKVCGRLRWYFWLPIWFVLLYAVANLWTKYVDPLCARLTQRLEDYVFEKKPVTQEKTLLPQ